MATMRFFSWYGLTGKLATVTMINKKEYWGKMRVFYKNAIVFNERCTDEEGNKFIKQVILNPDQVVSYELDEMLISSSSSKQEQEDQYKEQELKIKDEMGCF